MNKISEERMDRFEKEFKESFPDTKTVKNVLKDIPSILSNWIFIAYNLDQNHFEVSFNVDSNPTRVAVFMKVFLGKGYKIQVAHEHYVVVEKDKPILHWGAEAQELFLGTMEKILKVKFNQEIYNQVMLLQGQYGGKQ